MKKLLLYLLFTIPLFATAQDTLITVTGDTIACKIKMITPTLISFSDSRGDKVLDAAIVKKKIINSAPIFTDEGKQILAYKETQNHINLAGYELRSAAKTAYAGFTLQLIGVLATTTGILIQQKPLTKSSSDGMKVLSYGGIGLMSVGMIVSISAFSGIDKAGKHLDAYHPDKK